jgi:hypothetical protein
MKKMSSNKGAFYMIAMSILIAGAMIYMGNFVDFENNQTSTYLLLSLWFVLFGLIQQRTKKQGLDLNKKSPDNDNLRDNE